MIRKMQNKTRIKAVARDQGKDAGHDLLTTFGAMILAVIALWVVLFVTPAHAQAKETTLTLYMETFPENFQTTAFEQGFDVRAVDRLAALDAYIVTLESQDSTHTAALEKLSELFPDTTFSLMNDDTGIFYQARGH